MKRGEVWWADMPEPSASEPGFRRPVLIIQSNEFNQSQINTIIAAAISSNMKLGLAPGNVTLTKKSVGLDRESVINVSQLITLDKAFLNDRVGKISGTKMQAVDEGVRLVLAL
jgi:mRNA interferase MazF